MHHQQSENKKGSTIFHLYNLTSIIQIDFIEFHIHSQKPQIQNYQKHLMYISY